MLQKGIEGANAAVERLAVMEKPFQTPNLCQQPGGGKERTTQPTKRDWSRNQCTVENPLWQ